jgi:uncharacterized protein with GYD domain
MPRFVSLLNWTDQGVRNFKDTLDRAEAAQDVAKQLNGSLELYWTLGEFDIVAVSEFPDDESATAFLLKVGSLGNVRTKTMRAFTAQEMGNVIGRAG